MSRSRRRPLRRPSLPAILVCTLVWMLLWDQVTLLTAVSGAVLGIVVGLVFPLPDIALHGRFRPLALLVLGARLGIDLLSSSAAVIGCAFRFGHTPRSAIIGVQLRSRDELYLTQVAELVSLVPGSIVLEARPSSSTLYLHVLDTVTEADLERARRSVLDAEARVVRAFGDAAEIAAIENRTPWPGPAPAQQPGYRREESQ